MFAAGRHLFPLNYLYYVSVLKGTATSELSGCKEIEGADFTLTLAISE